MIHWGSSIPCALYINNRKECVINIPDHAPWSQITSEVSQKFKITPVKWMYTLTDLEASEEIASEEQFRKIKESCVRTRNLLQLNVCTRQDTDQSSLQSLDETNLKFQTAVEEAVKKYLSQHGAVLLQELAHLNNLCCCNRGGCKNVKVDKSVTQHQEIVLGDMVLENSDNLFTGNNSVFTGSSTSDGATSHNSVFTIQGSNLNSNSVFTEGGSHDSPLVASSSSSSIPLYSTFLSRDQPATPPSLPPNRNRKCNREETDSEQSSKKAKVIPPDKEYILAPCKNNIITTTPGTAVEVIWSLVVKHGVQSRWELVDEGGTIHPVGGAGVGRWSVSTDNIQEFSVQFVAPVVEGVYDCSWSLKQDGIVRETVILCCMKVVVDIESSKGGSSLACHGNIPADISVPKFLNSNKVFCMSSNEPPTSSNT